MLLCGLTNPRNQLIKLASIRHLFCWYIFNNPNFHKEMSSVSIAKVHANNTTKLIIGWLTGTPSIIRAYHY